MTAASGRTSLKEKLNNFLPVHTPAIEPKSVGPTRAPSHAAGRRRDAAVGPSTQYTTLRLPLDPEPPGTRGLRPAPTLREGPARLAAKPGSRAVGIVALPNAASVGISMGRRPPQWNFQHAKVVGMVGE